MPSIPQFLQQAIMARSGKVEVVAELAKEFGFTEEDGTRPASIRSLRYLLPNFVFPQVEASSGDLNTAYYCVMC